MEYVLQIISSPGGAAATALKAREEVSNTGMVLYGSHFPKPGMPFWRRDIFILRHFACLQLVKLQ
jgi:hypothetical protein